MRILIISQFYWPEAFRINDVAAGLAERGHEVVVLTGLPNYPGGKIFPGYGWFGPSCQVQDGVEIRRVPLVPRGRGSGFRLAINYLSFVLFACALWPLRLSGRFDAMLVFEVSPVTVGLPAVMIRRWKSVPLLFWVQDLWPESLAATGAVKSRRIIETVGRLVRYIYSRCDAILVQSRAFRTSIESLGASSAKIEYLPNSAEAFYKVVPRRECVDEDRELPPGFRVVFAGNLGAAQSLVTLLSAAELTRERSDIKWVVFGDGRERPWLEAEVERLGLRDNLVLMGARATQDMPRYFAVADVLLVTLRKSPIFALTIPSKVQSYLACGRPIVAAVDGEGARVVEEAVAGIACPAESPQALADTVVRLSRMSPEERQIMGDNGRRYFEREFGRDMLLAKLESLLERSRVGRAS